jgi:hypothetical protein
MIEKVVKKGNLKDQHNDFEYWQTQSYGKRLEQIEIIRKEVHGENYVEELGFQKVYRIVKFKDL